MSNNINISSGSKSFQNKIFGRVTKLTKPSFTYEGKIFSDSTFNNQKIVTFIEDNIYYLGHGLPDELIIYNEESIPFSGTIDIQNFTRFYLQNDPAISPIQLRSELSTIFGSIGSSTTTNQSLTNPYDDNAPPECLI